MSAYCAARLARPRDLMPHQRAKPAPGARQRASGIVDAGAFDGPQHSTSRRHVQLPGEITCYDGRACTGWLVPRGTGWLAYAASGKFLGQFGSDKLGARAIYEASRPGGAS